MADIEEVGNSLVSFASAASATAVRIRDEVGGQEFDVRSTESVSLEPASPDRFVLPVDAAVSFETSELRLPTDASAFVRDERGEHLGQLDEERWSFERGTYYVELSPAPKTYVLVDDASFVGQYPGRAEFGTAARLTFDAPTRVFVGARSPHERPQATITVPDDPEALMSAFSYLGSALKEYSCERSWPTIRGHPPALRRGDELDVPTCLERPETGVTIAVPPTYADVYRVAPLAYYLGAEVVPGEDAELRLDVGHTEPLRRRGVTLEEAVDRLLARCLLLDSLVRVGGYYDFERHEYGEIAPHLPFYPPELYDRSIDEQLLEYLEVPFDVLEPHVSRWSTTAVLRPGPEDVAVVPTLLDSLARIHVSAADDVATGSSVDTPVSDSTVTASAGRAPPPGEARLVPAAFDNARLHERVAPGACRFRVFGPGQAAADAFERVLDTADIDDESGNPVLRTDCLPSRNALQSALGSDVGFLHFGGPMTDEGFVCADGVLRWSDVEEVGAAVVSMAEPNVDGAAALVESGAVSAVGFEEGVTDETVGLVAGYLGSTYSLAWAAQLGTAGTDTTYRLAGDAAWSPTLDNGGTAPDLLVVASTGEDRHRLTYQTETTTELELGSVLRPEADFADYEYSLTGAAVSQSPTLSSSDVVDLYEEESIVCLNGTVYPTAGDLTVEGVRRSARRALDGQTRQS